MFNVNSTSVCKPDLDQFSLAIPLLVVQGVLGMVMATAGKQNGELCMTEGLVTNTARMLTQSATGSSG